MKVPFRWPLSRPFNFEAPPFTPAIEQIWHTAHTWPESIAIVSEGQELSYADLIEKAAGLSEKFIIALPEKYNPLIAICTRNPSRLIITAMAAWKAGCAYLPIDPSWPYTWIQQVLRESGAALITLDKSAVGHMAAFGAEGIPIIDLSERNYTASCSCDGRFYARTFAPSDLAYVMYTSGSTGHPKGVAVTQGNLHNLLEWYKLAFAIDHSDRVTQTGALTFDASVAEIWPALSVGATVHILDRSIFLVPEKLRDYIVSQKITLCQLATAPAEQLLPLKWPDEVDLRCLYTGGERLCSFTPPGLPFQFLNLYGPTECTVYATAAIVPTKAPSGCLPPIGYPILNTEIFILDSEMRMVPQGERGEVYIGGAGVAAGYIGRPDLTAEKFIANPFKSCGSRLYRTGDVGRMLPGGDLEYCGRADDQIKLLGNRIEPAEILAALRSHPCVSGAAIIARGDGANKKLIAYIVSDKEVITAELRTYLKARLPAYMVPNCFVRLETLPLTSNGKVDRAALPDPDPVVLDDRRYKDEHNPDAFDPIELELMEIWKQLLQTPDVSPDDDFFELGGNSLLAVRLFYKIQQRFKAELRPVVIMEASTVRKLATAIKGKVQNSEVEPAAVCLNELGSAPPLFLIHPVGGEVLTYRALALQIQGCPVYGVQVTKQILDTKKPASIEELASHYIRAITSVQSQGPYYLGGYSVGGLIAFEMQRQLQRMGETVAFLALIEPVIQAPAKGRGGQRSFASIFHLTKETVFWNFRAIARLGVRPYLQTKLGRSFASEFSARLRARIYMAFPTRNSGSSRLVPSLSSREAIELAALTYKPEPTSGHAVYYRSEGSRLEYGDSSAAWREIFSEGLTVTEIPGEHYAMMQEPHVSILAQQLNLHLNEVRSRVLAS